MSWKSNSSAILFVAWTASLLLCWGVDFLYFPPAPVIEDEPRFLASAAHWLSHGTFESNGGRAFEMPLVSMFFAVLRRLSGGSDIVNLYAIRAVQSFMLIGQSWLVFSITRRIFADRNAALLAAVITALYPFFIFYQGLAMSEALFDLLLVATFAALYAWRDAGCRVDGRLAGAMALAGLATYAKASLTVLPPLLLASAAWGERQEIRKILKVLAMGTLVYCAMLAPWWIRNYTLFDKFVPFTTSAASNLYLGNNAHNLNGSVYWQTDVEPEVVARINAMPNELDRQAAYGHAAMDFIRQHPGRFLELCIIRFKRYWNVTPNSRDYNSGAHAVVAASSFGPILLLALAGLAVNRAYWRALLPIYLLITYMTALHTVTIGSLRYRLPLESFLIILAAGTILSVYRRWPWPSFRVPDTIGRHG